MKKAFTLIELLVVIAIIALLVSILLPSLEKAKFLAKMTVCKSNMRTIGLGATLYSTEYDGKYPVGAFHNAPTKGPLADFFGYKFQEFIEEVNVFYCPLSFWVDKSWSYYIHSYGAGQFLRMPAQGWAGQSYMYFGNYSYDTVWHGIEALFGPEYIRDIEAGLIFPRDNSAARAKLFQDCVSDHYFDQTNHESPNSLYTDGSVEQGPVDPYTELDAYPRPHATYWW